MDVFNKLKSMKILIVDDDEWIRDSLEIFFEGEGCHLTALETAEEGIEALRRQDFDIIIADYKLPGMDGLKFLEFVKDTHPKSKKVLITAYRSNDAMNEAMRVGIEGVIEKPFTTKTLEACLTSILEKRL